jgi:signal peptidase
MKKSESKALRNFIRVKNIILAVVFGILFIIIALTMVARLTGGTPSLFGYSLYRVSSGSMEPALKIGDVILSRECDADSIANNDIVTYLSKSGSLAGKTITHRVIKPPYYKNGEKYIVTKGDANISEDDPVKASDVEGKFVGKVEILNYLYGFFITPLGLLTMIFLIIIAFFNEIIILVKAIAGIGYEKQPEESVEDIIERYQRENKTNNLPDSDNSSDDDNNSGG